MPSTDQISELTLHVRTYFWVAIGYKYHGGNQLNDQKKINCLSYNQKLETGQKLEEEMTDEIIIQSGFYSTAS